MTARGILRGAAATLAVAACVTVWGAEPRFPVDSTPGLQTRGTRVGAPEMRLSLQDAIAMALGHNINLEVSRLGLSSAEQGIVGSSGIFDPLLKADAGGAVSNTPSTNQLAGATVSIGRQRTFDLSIGQLLPTGGTLGLGFSDSRTRTNSSFFFLNPSYSSGLSVSFTQPFLRGFGTDVNRAGIEVARRSYDISGMQFVGIVIGTVQAVENAYWNLIFTIDDLQVKRDSLKLAQDLLDQTRTRVRIGTSAPIDIVQSEATVAAREQDIILAENAVENAADILKGLMGFENPEDWKSRIVPVDALEVKTKTVELDKSIEVALQQRPELKQRDLERQIGETNLLVARNATRPQLNFSLNYGVTGVGGDETLLNSSGQVITYAAGSWEDALRQIYRLDYKQWSAGLNFSYPLGNHQAKAQLAQRRFDLATAQQNIALQEQTVISDVRNAVRGLEAGAKSIAAAVKSRELAERNLDAEQKKFANGMSTNYQVLKIQDDLAAAKATELQSRVFYRQAEVAYQVALGTLLESMGVVIKEEAAPAEPHTALRDVSWLRYGHYVHAKVATGAPAPEPKP